MLSRVFEVMWKTPSGRLKKKLTVFVTGTRVTGMEVRRRNIFPPSIGFAEVKSWKFLGVDHCWSLQRIDKQRDNTIALQERLSYSSTKQPTRGCN